jgi:hypothetical protein
MNVEHWWNDSEEKPKHSVENLPRYHIVHQKSYMEWPEIEPGPPRWMAGG